MFAFGFSEFVDTTTDMSADVLPLVGSSLQDFIAFSPAFSSVLDTVEMAAAGNLPLVELARLFGRADVANFAQAVIDLNNVIVENPLRYVIQWHFTNGREPPQVMVSHLRETTARGSRPPHRGDGPTG